MIFRDLRVSLSKETVKQRFSVKIRYLTLPKVRRYYTITVDQTPIKYTLPMSP